MVNPLRILSSLALLPALVFGAPVEPERRESLAPLKTATHKAIADSYIVVLNDDADPDEHLRVLGINLPAHGVKHVFKTALKGYSGVFNAATIEQIRANPKVAYVEEDQLMHTLGVQTGAGYGLAISSENGKLATSQQNTYYYADGAGSGITAYVVDTGINTAHTDFGGRASMVANYVSGSPNTDENGHGTHCSGTIGGSAYGIAKSIKLAGVKVLDKSGSGSTSNIVAAINWVASNATPSKSLISMSLGGGYSASLNSAVRNADSRGITVIVAAGNENQDACNVSPASEASAITVAAIDSSYTRAYFSNYGSCTDIFGPGVNIKSAWIGSTTATNTISGTSMATPHIAGIVGYLLSRGATASNVKSLVSQYADRNFVSDPVGSPNLLGNNGYFK